jgi:hypothetical protein
VKEKKDFKKVCDHVEVCLILHNLMCDFNDEWDEEIETEEDAGRVDHLLDDELDEISGQELRRRVQNYVLAWYHSQFN